MEYDFSESGLVHIYRNSAYLSFNIALMVTGTLMDRMKCEHPHILPCKPKCKVDCDRECDGIVAGKCE